MVLVFSATTALRPGNSSGLIPMAASLFGIDNATAMQVVSVGFIIGIGTQVLDRLLSITGTLEYFTGHLDVLWKVPVAVANARGMYGAG